MATEPPEPVGTQVANLTVLLNQMQHGDHQAAENAVGLVYGELHRIAARELRAERPGHLLQTTALINEAYARLVGSGGLNIQSRFHFFAIASQQMRRILVDYARARNAQRRGGGAINIGMEGVDVEAKSRSLDLLLLDESLRELLRIDARAAQIVELRFFGGYAEKEIAEALGLSLAMVRRDWEFARSWLFQRMHGDGPDAPADRV